MKKVSERIVNRIKSAIENYNTVAAKFATQTAADAMQQAAFERLTADNNARVAFISNLASAERDEAGAYLVSQEVYDSVEDLTY